MLARDAARLIGVPETWLIECALRGEIPFHVSSGGTMAFVPAEIQRALARERERQAPAVDAAGIPRRYAGARK